MEASGSGAVNAFGACPGGGQAAESAGSSAGLYPRRAAAEGEAAPGLAPPGTGQESGSGSFSVWRAGGGGVWGAQAKPWASSGPPACQRGQAVARSCWRGPGVPPTARGAGIGAPLFGCPMPVVVAHILGESGTDIIVEDQSRDVEMVPTLWEPAGSCARGLWRNLAGSEPLPSPLLGERPAPCPAEPTRAEPSRSRTWESPRLW